MKRLFLAAAAAVVLGGISLAAAATCFFDRDETSGLNKICFYKCASGPAAITIGAAKLCPLTIQR